MTFSVTGHCERTGMVGVAITTSSICVASRCPWGRAGVGAVATQNITDPSIGDALLDRMQSGDTARAALKALMDSGREHLEYRQIALVDKDGGTAHHTGTNTLGINNVTTGAQVVAAGNLLSTTAVTDAMAASFESGHDKHLAERLLEALSSGERAGGEMGSVRSAGLLVYDTHPWPLVDLRVDWHDTPIAELETIWKAYLPQMDDYVTRALDPASAPAYGVPGDP